MSNVTSSLRHFFNIFCVELAFFKKNISKVRHYYTTYFTTNLFTTVVHLCHKPRFIIT